MVEGVCGFGVDEARLYARGFVVKTDQKDTELEWELEADSRG